MINWHTINPEFELGSLRLASGFVRLGPIYIDLMRLEGSIEDRHEDAMKLAHVIKGCLEREGK